MRRWNDEDNTRLLDAYAIFGDECVSIASVVTMRLIKIVGAAGTNVQR
jgi:hypothetical protein